MKAEIELTDAEVCPSGWLVTFDQFLAVHDARLAAEQWRGMATFFPLDDAVKCTDESKRATWARLETWAKSSGYRMHKNHVDYVCVIRDAVDTKQRRRAK
jgi:hypothetical protein